MKVVSSMEAANPSERPVTLVARPKESRLMILNMFLRVNVFLFRSYNNFTGTSRAGINLTSCAGKAIAA